ncbi:MAG: AI-2E family transporter [Gracilibacteraceae bacterium]|jgi:predicted PurR-regulated permease PerM|nr:AI-2E family transporter [Gracilibacteraceae bacterium]
MRPEWNKNYTTIAVYAFLVLAAGLVFYNVLTFVPDVLSALQKLGGFLKPVANALILAYLLNPLVRVQEILWDKLTRNKVRPKIKRAVSIFGSYIIAIVLLVILFAILIPQLVNSVGLLAGNVPVYWEQLSVFAEDLRLRFPDVDQFVGSQMDVIAKEMQNILDALLNTLTNFSNIYNVTRQITTGLLQLIIGAIVSIYVLFNKDVFSAQIKKLIFAFLSREAGDRLLAIFKRTNDTFSSFFLGKILDSAIVGVLCFISMSIFSLPYALLISVIVGATNIIPYFGPFIGAIPSIFIIFIVNPVQALWFGILILILQQLDGNIIGPKILGKTMGLSAFWVIVALLVFGGWLGIIGLVIGVPIVSLLFYAGRVLVDKRLEQKGLPVAEEDYMPVKEEAEKIFSKQANKS